MPTTELDAPQRMQCMEIWGGNLAIDKSFAAPGIDFYVHSAPYMESQHGGGDIYYVTSCASGRISRFLLADVSGHGAAASRLAIALRDLMRENVNRISQEQFVQGMNREFGNVANASGFATAVVATFFEPRKSLSISVAGHPYPIFYRSSEQRWLHLDSTDLDEEGIDNLPLGIRDDSGYPYRELPIEVGDMFLLYSDAFIESVNAHKQYLGIRGVVELLNESQQLQPTEVIPFLRERIGSLAEGNLLEDDATLVLGYFTSTKVRMRDNLAAPLRLFSKATDRTQLLAQHRSISPT